MGRNVVRPYIEKKAALDDAQAIARACGFTWGQSKDWPLHELRHGLRKVAATQAGGSKPTLRCNLSNEEKGKGLSRLGRSVRRPYIEKKHAQAED